MTLFLGKWLSLAFLVEALIVHYLDPAWIAAALGGDQPFAIPLATAIGIPLYTSGVAAIPITEGLLASGMSPGAALAFLIAGPVTTVPAMLAVWALVKGGFSESTSAPGSPARSRRAIFSRPRSANNTHLT